jgi:hypothetical protein
VAIWLVLDSYFGYYFFDYFTCMASNDTAQVWVQNYLGGLPGDTRPMPTVTTAQAEYILDEFTTNIRPTDITYFGAPDARDGSNAYLNGYTIKDNNDNPIYTFADDYFDDSKGRDVILVSNIVDDNYYFPTYPYYVAGFFSPSFIDYFDRNIISIDAYDWLNRVGPGTSQVYEGTVAHEYQHLIHHDIDPLEEDWVNEGCSMYAETLCGYGFQGSSVNRFMYTPDNSLTIWEDQGGLNVLADYGQVYLFMMYLNDHYGGSDTIAAVCASQEQGIAGIMDGLFNRGFVGATFRGIFRNWVLANYFLSFNDGPYGYISYDVASLVNPLSVNMAPGKQFYGSDLGETYSYDGDATGFYNLGPWAADYIMIGPGFPIDLLGMWFNGENRLALPYFWEIDTLNGRTAFWGGATDLALSNYIYTPLGLTGSSGATLAFDTYYDIEAYWDYGFVQVSADGGQTWTSLANGSTTTLVQPQAINIVVDNLPGITSTNGGWTTEVFDLSTYDGMDILLRFYYVTDWVTAYPGWYIDNIVVSDATTTFFEDSCDTFEQWLQPSDLEGYFDADYLLMFIKPDGTIVDIPTSAPEEMAEIIANFGGQGGVLVVAYTPDHGLATPVDYLVEMRQSGGAVVATFPMYGNVLPQLNAKMSEFMLMLAALQAGGEDTSAFEAALAEANELVGSASFGANYLFRANQLRRAMQILASLS